MLVALDATPLSVPTGGIRRYTEELHRALSAEFPRDEFVLLGEQGERWIDRRWWTMGLPRQLARRGADVFHGTDFAVPYVHTRPAVMTVHDLSPWKREAWRAESARVRRRTPWLLRLGLADIVVTPTEAVRRETVHHFRLAPDRVVAVPLAADAATFHPGGATRDYFLCVGTIEPRKNLGVAIDAWRELQRRGHACRLVLAGRNLQGIAEEPGLEIAGAVPDGHLRDLYAGAIALLFPSLYEGFGLPLLEAMLCGRPVIASRDAALIETAGGRAVHADAGDVRGWVEAMEAAMRGTWDGREALEYARTFTWARTARKMREVYCEAIQRHGR